MIILRKLCRSIIARQACRAIWQITPSLPAAIAALWGSSRRGLMARGLVAAKAHAVVIAGDAQAMPVR
jgi:hypothetical protein